ncbi:hypothetical protein [Sphingobacterium faecium]|uniref:hypothetical protein n=1 Tax=Sphingobacterium faecium TaxID=34087 RepID=UPI002468A46F|nr:hypothetical protein [Sphingobacterium faecium]MDH5825796.1 hypothetical protein [Sphingobacterium faecium]
MDNSNKILQLFLADKDNLTDWMRKPFTVNGKTGATNAYSVVLLPFDSAYEDMGEKFEGIIPTPNCSIRYSVAKLKECYTKIPLVDIPAEKICPECDGDGEVEFEFYGKEYTHYKDIDCPLCDGKGFIIDLESKKCEQEPDQTKCIVIGMGKFNCFRVSEIIQTAELLSSEYFILIHQQDGPNGKFLFAINDVEIITVGILCDSEHTVAILEREV